MNGFNLLMVFFQMKHYLIGNSERTLKTNRSHFTLLFTFHIQYKKMQSNFKYYKIAQSIMFIYYIRFTIGSIRSSLLSCHLDENKAIIKQNNRMEIFIRIYYTLIQYYTNTYK